MGGSRLTADVRRRVDEWIAGEVDPAAADELRVLLSASSRDLDAGDRSSVDEGVAIAPEEAAAELSDRFAGPLAFGTAGLRGPLRAGPNGMNRAVVRRTSAGLASWLADQGRAGQPVVVGFDARHGSTDFARDAGAVFAAAGFDARLLPGPLPTPVLAFAVQRLSAAAGVMITASHNPPRDNGYKVYAADGAQIVPPADREIEAAISAVGPATAVELAPHQVTELDGTVVDEYVTAIAALPGPGPRALHIVYTALHGVGGRIVLRAFAAAGFARPTVVTQQQEPDPDFPTVTFPNPEEPGALDLAVALARERGADIVIANDPDADRCAVAVPTSGQWRALRGDEVGVLLADALLAHGRRGTYATTIVSSSMLQALAAAHGVGYAETLTGFKWISRAASDLVFGYEEALGYAVAPELVRDKDGMSAALLVAARAAELAAHGSSLLSRLDELAAVFGRHVTDQLSVRVADLADIGVSMRALRADPPRELLGRPVTVTDLSPAADVVRLAFSGGRVVVRPSGTEPKLKAYLEIVERDGSAEHAARQLAALREEVAAALRI
jgi:phosphomannomutase